MSGEKIKLGVEITPDLRAKLTAHASKTGRRIQWIVQTAIERFLRSEAK